MPAEYLFTEVDGTQPINEYKDIIRKKAGYLRMLTCSGIYRNEMQQTQQTRLI